MENRVAAALQLGAKDEFRIYLFMYAKRLGAEGLKNKVEELLRSILGGILQDKNDGLESEKGEGWLSEDEKLCDWDRKELLKEVVLILGKPLSLRWSKPLVLIKCQENFENSKDSLCNMRGFLGWMMKKMGLERLMAGFIWRRRLG